jgi:alpha-beta hydrolase superfamily lysophospholipase
MEKSVVLLTVGILFALNVMFGSESMKIEKFTFEYDGKKYSGLLDMPIGQEPTSIVIIVQGYGKSDIVAGNWYYDLRSHFVQRGLACCLWDKPGCGKSEGNF